MASNLSKSYGSLEIFTDVDGIYSADPRIVRVVLSLSAPGESAIAPTAI